MELEREGALHDLMQLARPVREIAADLAQFGIEAEDDALVFDLSDAIDVVHRFVDGDVSRDDLAIWAKLMEARSDIAWQGAAGELGFELVFRLANPTDSPFTTINAREWLSRADDMAT